MNIQYNHIVNDKMLPLGTFVTNYIWSEAIKAYKF